MSVRVRRISGYKDLLYAALIIFSVVSLSSLEFMKNAFPSTYVVGVPKTTVLYLIVLGQVLPALLLLCADRLIAAKSSSGRPLRVFRTLLFVGAVVLIVRQLQLYWDPAEKFTDTMTSSGLFLRVVANLAFLAALAAIAVWLFKGLTLFFAYMSPVAIAMTVLLPYQAPTNGPPDGYGQEVETASQSESKPAVFILVFDELGYDVLLQEGGQLDAESFPNFASLAEDGVWFTNATTNWIWTSAAIPALIGPVESLSADFNIRLYTQYRLLEKQYYRGCVSVMTCRGEGYLAKNDHLRIAANLALRSFYQAAPKLVEKVIARPMGWLLDREGWAYPPVDWMGVHTSTNRQFSVFLDDIKGRDAMGRIHLLHLILPHAPMAFDHEGEALSGVPATKYDPERYRQQTMYADVLLGEFLSKLKSEGIYDDSVIVLTGDHGPRGGKWNPPNNGIPHVPLVIRAPGLNSGQSDVDYQHRDFGPTLTDILGLPPPDEAIKGRLGSPALDGVSAFSEERPQRDKVFYNRAVEFVYSEEDGSWHPSQTQ